MSAHQSCEEMVKFNEKMSRADEEENNVASYNECVHPLFSTFPSDKHHHGHDEKNAVYSYVSTYVKLPGNIIRDSQDVPYASASQAKPVIAAISLESAIVGMVCNQRQMVSKELRSTEAIQRKFLILQPPLENSHTIASP